MGGRQSQSIKIVHRLLGPLIEVSAGLFADATLTILNPIASRSGLITFHGPDLIWGFGREMSPKILEHTMNVFCGERIEPLAPNPFWKQQISDKTTTYRDWKCIRPGRSSGPLVGGHLASNTKTERLT